MNDVLLLYDASDTSLVSTIENLVLACGKSITTEEADEFDYTLASNYPYIFSTSNLAYANLCNTNKVLFCIGKDFANTFENITTEILPGTRATLSYENYIDSTSFTHDFPVITASVNAETYGEITLSLNRSYPFAVKSSNYYYVPYLSNNDSSFLITGALFQKYFHQEALGKLYVMFDEVYAFEDLELLSKTAALLNEHGIPYIINAMPVYEHYDYTSFKRFTQVLRYIQAQNGTIILHKSLERDEIEVQISTGIEHLDLKYQQAVSAFENEGVHLSNFEVAPYKLNINQLDHIDTVTRNFGQLPFNAVLCYDVPKSEEELNQLIDVLSKKWLSFFDLSSKSIDGIYTFNEEPIELTNSTTQADKEKPAGNFSNFFKYGSNFLFVVIGLTIIGFIVVIILGRRIYNQKFYK